MKNIWGYIPLKFHIKNSLSSSIQNQQQNNSIIYQQINIKYYQLKQIYNQLTLSHNICILSYPYCNLSNQFYHILNCVKKIIGFIQEAKFYMENNQHQIKQFQSLQQFKNKHQQIINQIQSQFLIDIQKIQQQKKNIQNMYTNKIVNLENIIKLKQQQLNNVLKEIQIRKEENQTLTKMLNQKNTQIQCLNRKLNQTIKKIDELTVVEDSSIRLQTNLYNYGEKVSLQTIFSYSKIRHHIYTFISPSDFLTIQLLNKSLHYICTKTIKKQYITIMIKNKNNQLLNIQKQIINYQQIINQFSDLNIRINAIKYLYYKIKPGLYILPFLQQQLSQQHSKIQEKSKFNFFFLNKNQSDHKEKFFHFDLFKNDHQQEQVKKKIDIFFSKLFDIDAQNDLKQYNNTIKKQSQQLKSCLKTHDKTIQLFYMTKYLYIQITQLNNLLQVCFALLITQKNNIKLLSKKNYDFQQNDKVLRNLIQQLTNYRDKVQKRIFYLENQNIQNRDLVERFQFEANSLKEKFIYQKDHNVELKNYIKTLQSSLHQRDQQIQSYSNSWSQISHLLSQHPLNQNLFLDNPS